MPRDALRLLTEDDDGGSGGGDGRVTPQSVLIDAQAAGGEELVRWLVENVGLDITAYITDAGEAPDGGRTVMHDELNLARMRVAYRAARLLHAFYSGEATVAWLLGTNDRLGGESPARTLRTTTDPAQMAIVADAAADFAAHKAVR